MPDVVAWNQCVLGDANSTAGGSTQVGTTTTANVRAVSESTQRAMLRDDALRLLRGTVSTLNKQHNDNGQKAWEAVRRMHAALFRSCMDWSAELHKKKEKLEASASAREAKKPTQENLRKEFIAWARRCDKEIFSKVLDWKELDGPFPAHLLNRKILAGMLHETAPTVYKQHEPLLCQSQFRDARGEKRPAEVEKRMALGTTTLMQTARIHSLAEAKHWARFESLLLLAHKAGGAHHSLMSASRRSTSDNDARNFLYGRIETAVEALKNYMLKAVLNNEIFFTYLDNAFLSQTMRFQRADRHKDEGKAFTVLGCMIPYTQHANDCNLAPRFVCVGPRHAANKYYGAPISGLFAGAQFGWLDLKLPAVLAAGLKKQDYTNSITGGAVYKNEATQCNAECCTCPEAECCMGLEYEFVEFNLEVDLFKLRIDAADISEFKRMPFSVHMTERAYRKATLAELLYRELSAALWFSSYALDGCLGRNGWLPPRWRSNFAEEHLAQSPAMYNEERELLSPMQAPLPAQDEDETSGIGFERCLDRLASLMCSNRYRGTMPSQRGAWGELVLGGLILGCDQLTVKRLEVLACAFVLVVVPIFMPFFAELRQRGTCCCIQGLR